MKITKKNLANYDLMKKRTKMHDIYYSLCGEKKEDIFLSFKDEKRCVDDENCVTPF